MNGITSQSVLDCLNSAFEADPVAMHALICNRVPCRASLADHPTIQVYQPHLAGGVGWTVGMLGIINGILSDAGQPLICVRFDNSDVDINGRPRLIGFAILEEVQES